MKSHVNQTKQEKGQRGSKLVATHNDELRRSPFQDVDDRPAAVAQRKLQEIANSSPQARQAVQLQEVANNNTTRQQPIQRYEEVAINPPNMLIHNKEYKHGDFPEGSKVSYSKLMVLEGPKDLWATNYMIEKGNSTLEKSGSQVRLRAGTAKTVKAFLKDISYYKVVPYKVNNVHNPLSLPGDCGDAAQHVMGAMKLPDGQAMNRPNAALTVDAMQLEHMRNFLFPGLFNSRYLQQVNSLPTLNIQQRADVTEDNHRKVFEALPPEGKEAFNRKYGYDEHAVAKPGQAYMMFPDQRRTGFPADFDGCPYHFGAVIMADGTDHVTLENFTGRNTNQWFFEMYGPKAKNQTFQDKWKGYFANLGSTTVVSKNN